MGPNKNSFIPQTRICLYRDSEGGSCFAGCLIPDADYLPEMENEYVGSIMISSVIEDKLGHDLELVESLQSIHDSNNFDEDLFIWEDEFRKLADDYGLVYSSPSCDTGGVA